MADDDPDVRLLRAVRSAIARLDTRPREVADQLSAAIIDYVEAALINGQRIPKKAPRDRRYKDPRAKHDVIVRKSVAEAIGVEKAEALGRSLARPLTKRRRPK